MNQAPRQPPSQIKLLVDSASEAVNLIRERYGEMAQVVSVRQSEASGLKRLLSKPRLEVVVRIPDKTAPSQAPAPRAAEPKSESNSETEPRHGQVETSAKPQEASKAPAASPRSTRGAVDKLYASRAPDPTSGDSQGAKGYFGQFGQSESTGPSEQRLGGEEPPLGSAANPVRRGTLDAVRRAISMLESVGFDRSLIERVRAEVDFKDIGTLPTMGLYAKICDWLRSRVSDPDPGSMAPRRAFIGCSGVGKTSALCKMLAYEVFTRGSSPTVLKIDSEMPNPSDGLEVFCSIMGSGLVRAANEVEAIDPHRPLLVDMPGYRLGDAASQQACCERLEALGIEERILVVNAAYESELIADMLAAGRSAGANRLVLTHMEETRRPGKLWRYLLSRQLEPIFMSDGANPAGDYRFDIYSCLLERSFPNGGELAAASGRAGGAQAPREEALAQS